MQNVMRYTLAGVAMAAVVMGSLIAALQEPFRPAAFEFQQPHPHSGYLLLEPFPRLMNGRQLTPLVAPGKHGAGPLLAGLDGRWISLSASRIHLGGNEMLELVPDSIQRSQSVDAADPPPMVPLGEVTLSGEIVDSKCFLGVMNPGAGRTHRECAIRCISGGVPPVFVALDGQGQTHLLWLTDPDGKPLPKQLLDYVAEPVRATGTLARQGNLTYFRINLGSLRRE